MAGSIPVHLRHFFSSIAALLVVLVVCLPAPAHGAARLLSTIPADGERLDTLEQVEFEFDTLLLATGAEVSVTRLDGTPFPVTETVVEGVILRATVADTLPSGNYAIGFAVQSADGAMNEGSIRVSVDAAEQSLGGGLIVIVVLAGAMGLFATLVFRADQRRRPQRR